MTPKLKLSEADRKVVLSRILKCFHRGTCRQRRSRQIIEEPKTKKLRVRYLHAFDEVQTLTTSNAADAGQDPSCCIVGGHGEVVVEGNSGREKEEVDV